MQLETELKLLCQPVVLGRIARHPAVRACKQGRAHSEQLISRYFDTPDGKLRAAGLALRIRSTPGGWVQTLKGEGAGAAGLQVRPEWEWPVPSEAVAGDVLADTPALKVLGGKKNLAHALASLAPMFETEFRRTLHPLLFADGSRAELCLDLGEVRTPRRTVPISEAEIELRGEGGDAARLYELGLALAEDLPVRLGYLSKAARGYALWLPTPSRPAKALPVSLHKAMRRGDAFRTIVGDCMAQMQANEAGLLAGRNDEYLHQMRVAIRRLRSALAIFRSRTDANPLATAASELRSLAQALGAARDWDVFCSETMGVMARALPGEAGLAALVRKAGRLRRMHDRAARQSVLAPAYTLGLLRMGQLLPAADANIEPGDESLLQFAAGILQKRHRRLRKLGQRMMELSSGELHRFRISAKKLRYAAEFFNALFPGRRTQAYIKALSRLQDVLGSLNDVAGADQMLGELCRPQRPDDNTMGVMRGWLAATQQRHMEVLPAAWEVFSAQLRFWKRQLPVRVPELNAAPVMAPGLAAELQQAPGAALVKNADARHSANPDSNKGGKQHV